MTNRPEIEVHRQTSFGDDGELEMSETSIETSLEDFGAEIDHREPTSRRDRPEASEFGVDDRPKVERTDASDQSTLFADTAADQQTLTGDDAQGQFLFEE
ncbi:hypothetical protein M0R89_03970 [Halorussus limi]|uniref:Uncharacterized protein n=1 Tax=Halorussus limi TaxID=2938695 RepID=A0A8U0HWT2_9EURY|nr:hypothetical protein [Halorussus limi]UPV75233.1 hypothetical protein M0R89_03970 [Halorussus limi]